MQIRVCSVHSLSLFSFLVWIKLLFINRHYWTSESITATAGMHVWAHYLLLSRSSVEFYILWGETDKLIIDLLPPGGSSELLAWGTCSLQGQSCIWTCINKSPDRLRKTEALSYCTWDAVTIQQPYETHGGCSPAQGDTGPLGDILTGGVGEKMMSASRHLRLAANVLRCVVMVDLWTAGTREAAWGRRKDRGPCVHALHHVHIDAYVPPRQTYIGSVHHRAHAPLTHTHTLFTGEWRVHAKYSSEGPSWIGTFLNTPADSEEPSNRLASGSRCSTGQVSTRQGARRGWPRDLFWGGSEGIPGERRWKSPKHLDGSEVLQWKAERNDGGNERNISIQSNVEQIESRAKQDSVCFRWYSYSYSDVFGKMRGVLGKLWGKSTSRKSIEKCTQLCWKDPRVWGLQAICSSLRQDLVLPIIFPSRWLRREKDERICLIS